MSDHSSAVGGGVSLATVLVVIFIVLKVLKLIAWSWWWVFSPWWISGLLFMGILVAALIVMVFIVLFGATFS